jgi:hypothetical protein
MIKEVGHCSTFFYTHTSLHQGPWDILFGIVLQMRSLSSGLILWDVVRHRITCAHQHWSGGLGLISRLKSAQ